MQNSENNKRIAKNTLMLYIRMLVLMLVSLYTSRIVLQALGVEDFGINNVVAGFVSILAFFTSSLSNASQRYLSIGLGKNDIAQATNSFRQSYTLMLIFSGIVLILGETIGLWFVANKLVIPNDRLTAALWVYQFALVSTFCSINQVTLVADIIARERMGIYAYLGIFESVARLFVAFMLQWVETIDTLILFGILTALISLITFAFHAWYCRKHFAEAKFKLRWDRSLVKGMSRFIGANLFGCFSWAAGVQGINIILNLFFGPVVNAARGIAVQVNGAVARFTDNVMTAIKPQIIKSYAAQEHDYMKALVIRSTKYMALLLIVLGVPIIFETPTILRIWLGQIPDYTVEYIRLIICEQFFSVLVGPLWIAANATGDIKKNQVYGRMITLLGLPISAAILLIHPNPIIPMIVLVIANMAYWIYCLYDIHTQINLNIKSYLLKAVIPTLITAVCMSLACFTVLSIYTASSIFRFLIVGVISTLTGGILSFALADSAERIIIYRFLKKIRERF